MPEFLDILAVVGGRAPRFRSFRLVLLVEAGTHLIVYALMCPYQMGERVPSGSRFPRRETLLQYPSHRVKKLLRSVTLGMLRSVGQRAPFLCIVNAAIAQGCDYLGRVKRECQI